ncbi:ankyrin repeat domain-containing protein, partial [Streptomyces sp. ISL-12]|uniref:ankyrin repeat domain-containing protein n=1 Tax=Streptomyces sp. ISL-12 TaxID=2819177 RepID=UPI001BEA849A
MDVEPWTLVHQAVENCDYEELSVLLDAGADPNEKCFEITLLGHAIEVEGDSALQSGCRLHGALTAIVLAYGADPNLESYGGQTPI